MICEGLEPELIRVLKLSVFKKKYEKASQIINKNDDFIFYFGSHFKIAEYKEGEIIMREGELPNKSKLTLIKSTLLLKVRYHSTKMRHPRTVT